MYRDGEIVPGQDWLSFGLESGGRSRAGYIGRKGPCGCGSRIRGYKRGKASGEPESMKGAKLAVVHYRYWAK